MAILRSYPYLLFTLILIACFSKKKPNITLINRDLGITIPKYTLLKVDSDPFGLGADSRNLYEFQFDSSNFANLEKQVSRSFLFNVASKGRFDSMTLPEKITILKLLAVHGMTGYWIQSGSVFLFDGDSILSNPRDNVFQYLPSKHIFLPNQDSTRVWQGLAMTVYTVRARIDRQKRTLYYQYVHI